MSSKKIDEALKLHAAGQLDAAETALREILSIEPGNPDALHLLGLLLFDHEQTDSGIELIRKAAALMPSSEAYRNSLAVLTKAKPGVDAGNFAKAMNNEGRHDEALAAYERSLALDPGFPNAHFNLGMELIRRGEFTRGFQEYEWRLQMRKGAGKKINIEEFPAPRWDGSDISGKRILIHAEQGFGDVIQMLRYARTLKNAGAAVLALVHRELARLAKSSPYIEQVTSGGDHFQFDLHCPLLSLPMTLKTTVETIPAQVPYLFADDGAARMWGERIRAAAASNRCVGICWAGNPKHLNDKNRSIPLPELMPILESPGLRFFSLQKGGVAPLGVMDWTNELADFADTAAMIASLDLVISVDTSVAHLAGAMGKPTYLLLPFVPDWRWMLNRSDSPWYPTIRLFRQPAPGDWTSVMSNVCQSLKPSADSKINS